MISIGGEVVLLTPPASATMSYNQGFHPQSAADRGALLAGLRGGQQQQYGMRSNPASMGNQAFDELQYMMMQQQMQFQQQPLPFQQQQQHRQQQSQFQNSAQAQLFALQQSQMELQLQQIKMANLALQEQLLMQHQQQQQQQQVRMQSPPQQSQTHQQHGPSYGNLAALGPNAANRRAGGRSVSAGPALSYASSSFSMEDANNAWRYNGAHNYSSLDTNYEVQADLGAAARHEVRRDALQNLQQARQQRSPSPAASASAANFSPPMANLDWQAQRMQYKSGTSSTPETAVVVTPPAQIDSGTRDYIQSNGAAQPLQQHRKNSSEVSDASIQSLSISEAETHVSPNRGPALVLSKPGDEFPEEGDDSTDIGPMSPSLTASMRATSIHGTLIAGEASSNSLPADQNSDKRRSSSGRHTVILSSSIVDLRRAAAGQNGRNSPFTDSESSSSASSPTSDKSEVASFESTNSTTATSVPNTSPTSVSFESKDVSEKESTLGLGRPPASTSGSLPARRAVSALPAASLNPSASVFAPGPSSKAYPSSLSASSANSGTATPMRLFSAPARNGTPTNVATIIRQPKGPADEKDLQAKNFAGMIRRKAVGALRLAAANGTRASPASSPVLGGFPSNVQAIEGGLPRFASNPTSPLANQTGFNMSDLATRAMRRRSAQGGYTAFAENPGLGMLQ